MATHTVVLHVACILIYSRSFPNRIEMRVECTHRQKRGEKKEKKKKHTESHTKITKQTLKIFVVLFFGDFPSLSIILFTIESILQETYIAIAQAFYF